MNLTIVFSQNFFLTLTDEIEKKKKLLRKLLKWANKNKIIVIFTMMHLKKIEKKTCRYHCQNLHYIICSSWDIEHNILKLVIWGHFFPSQLKLPKNQNSKKWNNLLEILSFYTCVAKITFIWRMVPEIRSETDRMF